MGPYNCSHSLCTCGIKCRVARALRKSHMHAGSLSRGWIKNNIDDGDDDDDDDKGDSHDDNNNNNNNNNNSVYYLYCTSVLFVYVHMRITNLKNRKH